MTRQDSFFSFISLRQIGRWLGYGLTFLRKKIIPQSLFRRFLLIVLAPLLLLETLITVYFFDKHWETVSRRLAQDISGEIGVIADLIDHQVLSPTDIGLIINRFNKKLSLQIQFKSQKKIQPTVTAPPAKLRALSDALTDLDYPFSLRDYGSQQTLISIQLPTGVLEAVVRQKRFFSSTVYVFLLWLFGFSVLLFWIAFLFMKNQVRAIVRLADAAEKFGRGQNVNTFKPEGATEVRQAGTSFILMKNRIQRYLSERTGMLSGVSHDLRTPLTRMKLQLSMMPASETVRDLQADVIEMEHMLEAYLSFARGEGKETPEKISFNQLVSDIVDKARKSDQDIDLHQECQVSLVGRPTELKRAVTNILTNAARYATKAHLTLGTYRKMARLIIDDNGPGIEPKKRADVFKAFYRVESSRNIKTGGVGLGLTITRDIILAHGGEIRLDDSPFGGLRVIILLPIA